MIEPLTIGALRRTLDEMAMIKTILVGLLVFSGMAFAKYTNESYYVYDKTNLKYFLPYKTLVVDHVSPIGFEVYGPKGLGAYIQRINVRAAVLKTPTFVSRARYATPEETAQRVQLAVSKFPQLAQMSSIGKSVKGRDLWVIKISKNVGQNDNRPEFKYIANMHGDEIIGREMMVLLIEDLLSNYGKDAFITNLVDTTQIYIMPSMNPDGAAVIQRGNANSVDLNRDFPDFSTSDNKNIPDGRAIETQAIMKWQASRHFVFSANFHGGAEVVSYPFDTIPDKFPMFDFVHAVSMEYASNAPYIGASKVFKSGITDGYDWYEVNGGMQDWSFHWYQDLQITIELSNQKYPDPSTVPSYYQQNRRAMLAYIARTHTLNQSRMVRR